MSSVLPVPISATILTWNSERRIREVLTALHWCDEVVVLDTGSTDRTLALARAHPNVNLQQLDGPFPGFGEARRRAVALARNDWILAIDSDEVLSPDLVGELVCLEPDPRAVYALPFHNHFNGRLITTCGWYPERHVRFFNRRVTDFCASAVHERVQTRGLEVRKLRHPVLHYSYDCADDFLRKMRAYGQLFAAENAGRKASSPARAIGRGLWSFFRSYVLQRGCLQGSDGFIISASRAQGTFWKYLLLHDANRQR